MTTPTSYSCCAGYKQQHLWSISQRAQHTTERLKYWLTSSECQWERACWYHHTLQWVQRNQKPDPQGGGAAHPPDTILGSSWERHKIHICAAALGWTCSLPLSTQKHTWVPKQRTRKNRTRRYKPTSEGMKGAMIPPTRENMEHAPRPTFLEGIRKNKLTN